ncbi:MAG: hypothetical protein AAF721_00720 [Myxococcota bacterium]
MPISSSPDAAGNELVPGASEAVEAQGGVKIGPGQSGQIETAARFFVALPIGLVTFVALALAGIHSAVSAILVFWSSSTWQWTALFGRTRALRALRQELDAPSALAAAERLLTQPWTGDAVRCDASAHAALLRLERGELEQCLELVERPPWNVHSERRPRSAEVGNYGEAVYAVLARLSRRVTTWPLPARVIADNWPGLASEYEGLAPMLGALRVLERAESCSAPELRRVWLDFDAESLARSSPVLHALVLERASRVEPALNDELGARYRALSPEAQAILRQRRPEVESLGQGGYRKLQVVATTALSRRPPAALDIVSTWSCSPLGFRRSHILAAVLLGTITVPALQVPGGIVAAALLAADLLYARDLRRRAAALAGITAKPRLRELTRRFGWDRGRHVKPTTTRLLAGLVEAQAAIRDGDRDRAEAATQWWYSGVSAADIEATELAGTGASLLRVAVLLGFRDEARLLHAGARAHRRPTLRIRSGHGDAPQAIALARALFHLGERDVPAAVAAFERASEHRRVILDPFERELYGELARRLKLDGPALVPSLANVPEPTPGLLAIWPEAPP